jgi:hypothetical protein
MSQGHIAAHGVSLLRLAVSDAAYTCPLHLKLFTLGIGGKGEKLRCTAFSLMLEILLRFLTRCTRASVVWVDGVAGKKCHLVS